MDEDLEFWRRFRGIGQKKNRKFLFKRTPHAEVKELYLRLLHDARKKRADYAAVLLLALAKSEEERGVSSMDEATTQKLQQTTSTSDLSEFLASSNSAASNATAKILTSSSRGQGERGRRRCEFARAYFLALEPYIQLQAAVSTVAVPHWSYTGSVPVMLLTDSSGGSIDAIAVSESESDGKSESESGGGLGTSERQRQKRVSPTLALPSATLQGGALAVPVALSYLAPVVLAPLALQSYILAAQVYLLHSKITMAASLRYEMAVQLERMGECGAAASQWSQAAAELLLNTPFTRSLDMLSSRAAQAAAAGQGGFRAQIGGKAAVRKATTKPVVKAPITAYCALKRAMESNLRTADYKRACANGLKLIDIFENLLPSSGSLLPGQEDIVAETKITLLFLYCIQRDFSNAHKVIQQLTEHTTQASSATVDARGGATSPQLSRKHSVASSRGWLLQVGFGPTNLLLSFYDFVMAFEERDVWAMEEVVQTLYPYLTCS
eukprot:CAMPEP_0114624520 /NCGR_PEP_ID=MMETSP0168-20121206/10807_1 /TAXON_ID=95228 ORGANISM="Vannella sp., Strain DIVA3 517/6/12" /NCGR_SAMPLE_ID=MMETSP0168 /ASSEMBLY_ACC=CAM_ASM_000044 /LENGTH=494 /DNA_ID=CAMNT_0001835793 /DNA_START=198 /DNA_END=1679 /DNA_ORIENTATION=+